MRRGDTLANIGRITAAVVLLVLVCLAVFGNNPYRYFPPMAVLCGLIYLLEAAAVLKTEGKSRRILKTVLYLLLTFACAALAYIGSICLPV